MRKYLEYGVDNYFTISESRDNKHHIYIKDHHDMFIMWIGYKGLIPGSSMKENYYNGMRYMITGIDDVGEV